MKYDMYVLLKPAEYVRLYWLRAMLASLLQNIALWIIPHQMLIRLEAENGNVPYLIWNLVRRHLSKKVIMCLIRSLKEKMIRDIIFYSIVGTLFLAAVVGLSLIFAVEVGEITAPEHQMRVVLTDINYDSSGDVIYSFCEKDVCYKLTEGNKANVDYFVVGNEYTAYYHNYWWGTEFDRLEG